MTFQFDSFSDFMAMGTHGYYVWVSYAVTFAMIVLLIALPGILRKRFIREQRALTRRMSNQTSNRSEHAPSS